MNPDLSTPDRTGEIIVAAVGKKRATLQVHPRMPTVGASVAEAVFLADFMQRAARLQLVAAAFEGVKAGDASAVGVRAISCAPSAS